MTIGSPRFVAASLLAWLMLTSPLRAQVELPGWIADPKSGCKTWNAYPQPNESISWSGRCVGGLAEGRGVLQWYQGGIPRDRFEGELRRGKHDGRGVYTFTNGDRYEGGWRGGRFHGYGIYADASGNRYQGEFRNGKADGPGTRWDADGALFSGTWINGCFRQDDVMATVGWIAWKCAFR
jgi:hypothetical protein